MKNNIKEIFARCTDKKPALKIKQKIDWEAISQTTIQIGHFALGESSIDDLFQNPHCILGCTLWSYSTEYGEPLVPRAFYVAIFPEENGRPDVFSFERIDNAMTFVRDFKERFQLLSDAPAPHSKLDLEKAHTMWADNKKKYAKALKQDQKREKQGAVGAEEIVA